MGNFLRRISTIFSSTDDNQVQRINDQDLDRVKIQDQQRPNNITISGIYIQINDSSNSIWQVYT